MKRLSIFILAFWIFIGCKSDGVIQFCEGVSPEGVGTNCGNKFSAGDLTLLINAKEPFGINSIKVNIFEKGEYIKKKIESFSIEVKADKNNARSNISLFDEGIFIIEVTGKDDQKIADAAIEIIDVY